MKEEYREIEGYEGLYKISNLGNVYSVRFNRLLRVTNRQGWYNTVSLSYRGIKRTFNVHSLVAQAFIPNPDNKPEINHIDGDKTNNKVDNLEWVTRAENVQHAYDTGLEVLPGGERDSHAKLSDKECDEIIDLYRSGLFYQREIADMYKISRTRVSSLINGRYRKNFRPRN